MIIFIVAIAIQAASTTDYDNARILGAPKLLCSNKSLTMTFDTNIPFQGRVSLLRRLYVPECNSDFSTNMHAKATFKMDLQRCLDATTMTNGSRILSGHVQIGFHPLVITSSDRVFFVQCVDNSHAMIKRPRPSNPYTCTHAVRLAARWENSNVFHVGDAVVHEWNCKFKDSDVSSRKVFLSTCDAIAQTGPVIHLIDENGCIIDPELMGELVYNGNFPKIYARAKMFRFINGERFRIECSLHVCKMNSTCAGKTFPPKCAYTKEEIAKRHNMSLTKKKKDDDPFTISQMATSDKKIRVTSEWLNVNHNQYTNVEQLHERYFIRSLLNSTFVDTAETTTRNPQFPTILVEKTKWPNLPSSVTPLPLSKQDFSLPSDHPNAIDVNSTDDIFDESSSAENLSPLIQQIRLIDSKYAMSTSTLPTMKVPASRTSPATTTSRSTATEKRVLMKSSDIRQLEKLNKVNKLAKIKFYPTTNSKTTSDVTEMPFANTEIFTQQFVTEDYRHSTQYSKISMKSSKYDNRRDWRLDDRTVNDTDIYFDKQVSGSNATIITSETNCVWSNWEHLLMIWSFGSLVIWIVLLLVCLYHNYRRKQIKDRPKVFNNLVGNRILPQEHPWLHADAFEEPRLRHKHEMEMCKF